MECDKNEEKYKCFFKYLTLIDIFYNTNNNLKINLINNKVISFQFFDSIFGIFSLVNLRFYFGNRAYFL